MGDAALRAVIGLRHREPTARRRRPGPTRTAEDDGHAGLFAALFEVEKPKAKAAKAKAAKEEPKAT